MQLLPPSDPNEASVVVRAQLVFKVGINISTNCGSRWGSGQGPACCVYVSNTTAIAEAGLDWTTSLILCMPSVPFCTGM
ncbi:hypothetical protein GDO81_005172 [Engystomops pustulosus]|uniref:Galectin n=1 Tax=Engystomops pustulosus TaxID=76066 RepID=A0AAV7CM10_ENGPU|nr:hypothetical protein GDO81_005172 [Engystomops pustulosus]